MIDGFQSLHLAQIDIGKLCQSDRRSIQTSVRELGSDEIGPNEIGAAQVSFTQIGRIAVSLMKPGTT